MEKILNTRSESQVSSPLSNTDSLLGDISLAQNRQIRQTITVPSGAWIGEEDTIVYDITDYPISLIHASEMMSQGYHVTTLFLREDNPHQPTTTSF